MNKLLNLLDIEKNIQINEFRDIYTAKITLKNLPFISFGKGFNENEAITSALGEMYERIFLKNYFEDYALQNLYHDQEVKPFEIKKFYEIDLEKEDLIDFNSNSLEILSIPFGDTYFPINLIQNLFCSNGMAFHKNFKKAYYNAKCEIIERYVKFKVLKEKIPLQKIEHKYNDKNIQIYRATLNKYPVMAASYIKDNKIILSFGCDIDETKAIDKAYLELLQTEFKEFGEIGEVDEFELERHFINLSGNVPKEVIEGKAKYKWISKLPSLKEYIRKIEYKGYVALHLIVPNFSEVYPIDDLIYNNKNYGKFIRLNILSQKDIEYTPYELGSLCGYIFKKPFYYEDYIHTKNMPEFDEKYLNLIKFNKELNNEIRQM